VNLPGTATVAARRGSVSTSDSPIETTIARVWRALETVMDPEIPVVSIVELGLIRSVEVQSDGRIEVGLSPTYVGCPATEVIAELVAEALARADVGESHVRRVLSPAWSSEWITEEGRHKLEVYGVVPPEKTMGSLRPALPGNKPLNCPRCHSRDTERVSEFGSTPCKALHRCRACLEPFEYFKCI
jgi:ring-1,2-phenylacetyl-CoA epoxidase subunit PaaD